MFDNLKDFLEGSATLEFDAVGQASPRELQIATTALLLHMGTIDNQLADGELRNIVGLLNLQFGLSDAEAGDLLEVAEYLLKDHSKLATLAAKVKDKFSDAQKITVLGSLYKVMLGDGSVSEPEAWLASHITGMLGLDTEDFNKAKEMVKAGEI